MDIAWMYVDLYSFQCVHELGVAYKRAAGAFLPVKKALPDLWTM